MIHFLDELFALLVSVLKNLFGLVYCLSALFLLGFFVNALPWFHISFNAPDWLNSVPLPDWLNLENFTRTKLDGVELSV